MRLQGGGGSFALYGWEDEAPVQLAPNERIELEVEFSPTTPGVHQAQVEVYLGADPQRVAVTELLGEGMPFRVRGGGGAAAAGDAGLVSCTRWRARALAGRGDGLALAPPGH